MPRVERSFPIFVLTASALILGGALMSQYWGGLAPCELCLKQRWPWTAAIVIAFVATMTGSRTALARVALLLGLVFAIGSALAFYHVGVEQHWFPGPSACTAPALAAGTLEALKAQILHQQPVLCDQVAWSLWGVSLAGWNVLASLIMTVLCFGVFARVRRRSGLGRGMA